MKKFTNIIRQQSGQARVAILLATMFVALMPFFLASTYSPLHGGLSNKALAAHDASDRAVLMQDMSRAERARYGRTVRELLVRDPDAFLNLVEGDLAMALSVPSLKRTDGSVQIWQYRSGVCVLDVFLQDDSVVHYEMRGPGKAVLRAVPAKSGKLAPDSVSCMKALVRI